MLKKLVQKSFRPIASYLHQDRMARLGIRNTMRLAQAYNKLLYGKYWHYRKNQYQHNFSQLLEENKLQEKPALQICDGWALDTSNSLPYLKELLEEADEVIQERGGTLVRDNRYRSFFRNLIEVKDLDQYPSFLNFITSSELLAVACEYLKYVPCLTKTLPTGVRFAESSMANDAQSHLPPRDSQLYHIDPYATPEIYVIVLLEDVTEEKGPFTFIPESLSQDAAKKLRYWSRGKPFRLSDEEVYSVIDPKERYRLIYPKGTVLFIDPSRCFHYGSRETKVPRYQMMYALAHPCRTDFSEALMPDFSYTIKEKDSHLRKMILDKTYMGA